MSSITEQNSAKGPTPTASPGPLSQAAPVKPNYSAFSGLGASQTPPQVSTPQPFMFQQQQPAARSAQVQAPAPASDPFATLGSPLRNVTPQPPSSALRSTFDFSQPASPAPPTPAIAAADDDDWAFSSALPESNGLPSSHDITVTDTSVNVTVRASRKTPSDPVIALNASFSSKVAYLITELEFQVAVTKGYSLKMEPQTGRRLQPYEVQGIKQIIFLNGVEYGKGSNVKLRWKVSYKVGTELKNEAGEISTLGIA